MDRKEWIKSLKPGDIVVNAEYSGIDREKIYVMYKVKNLTPKGRIRLENGALLDDEGRGSSGDVWNRRVYYIQPLTEEIEQYEIDRRAKSILYYEVKEMLRGVSKLSLSVEDLKAMHKILKGATKK